MNLLDRASGFDPIEPRKPDVYHDKIGSQFLCLSDGIDATGYLRDNP
jgi:hypothetical protein